MEYLMRIAKNDKPFDAYTVATAPDAEGYMVQTLTQVDTIMGDLQPIGGKFDLSEYGINTTPAEAKKLFYDVGLLAIGMVLVGGGKKYMVKGVDDWYSHSMAILEPYEVATPAPVVP
jgi:hypothetical protein